MFSVVEDKNDPTPPISLIPEELTKKKKTRKKQSKWKRKYER
jgi:hypothetical protein